MKLTGLLEKMEPCRQRMLSISRKRCYRSAVLLVILCAAALSIKIYSHTMQDMAESASAAVAKYATSHRAEEKPIMYTFYNRIASDEKHTGMTDKADDELLKVWKEEWNKAGWNAQILDLEDAKRHPRFFEFEEKLEKVSIHGINKVYNKLCYYRWLAMAAVGGGWMSDFDVLPLNLHKPDDEFQDGTFTIFGGNVPCLMSGSQSEWERMAFAILDNGAEHPHDKLWSDMYAVINMKVLDFDSYRTRNYVTSALAVSSVQTWTKELCEEFQEQYAIHFSHHLMGELGADINSRSKVAKDWLNQWRKGCKI
jgi:hypothetical protein